MIKKSFFTFLVIVFGAVCPIYGAINNSGEFNLTNSSCFGDMVNNKTGVIEGKDSLFLGIVNQGTVNLDTCKVKREFKSSGQVNAVNTKFEKNVTISGGHTTLDNCELVNLFIDSEENSPVPKVILWGETAIGGYLTFLTGKGEVYVGPRVVYVGEIVNGSIIKLDHLPGYEEY